MDDEEIGLNVDSFVDIVANTAGILTILALVPIIGSHIQGERIHVDRRVLRELRQEVATMQDVTIPEKKAALAQTRQDIDDAHQQVIRIESRMPPLRAQAREFSERVDVAQAELARVQRKLEAQGLRTRQLKYELAKAEPPAVDVGELEEDSPEVIAARRARELLRVGRERLERTRSRHLEVRRALPELALQWEPKQAELEALRRQTRRTLDLTDSPRRITGRQPVLVECFAKDDGAAAAQLVSPENYSRQDEDYRRKAPGQLLSELQQKSGKLGRLLRRPPAAFQKRHFICCLVRPDGFDAFRRIRTLAAQTGWDVKWELLPAGDVISLQRQ
jgi:hypothetical protein